LAFAFRPTVVALVLPPRPSSTDPVSRPSSHPQMHRLANPFAAAHTSEQPLDRFAARSVKTLPPRDPARLPSRGTFLRPTPFDACRVRRGTRSAAARSCSAPLVLPPTGLALRPFASTMPCCFSQTRLSRLGPRSRPRIGLIADASSSQTQPLDFCNEFSMTTHEHIPASAVLTRRRGLPCERCRARRALHAALAILF
jgi:hypothetical protein